MAAAPRARADWADADPRTRGGPAARCRHHRAAREDWGPELAREEGKTRVEGRGEVLRAAQILRYYAAEGDR